MDAFVNGEPVALDNLSATLNEQSCSLANSENGSIEAQLFHFHDVLLSFVEASLRTGLDESFYQRLLEHAVEVIPQAQAGSILLKDEGRFRFVAAVNYDLKRLQQVCLYPHELMVDLESFEPQHIAKYEVNSSMHHERRIVLEEAGRTQEIKASLAIPIQLNASIVAYLHLDNFVDSQIFYGLSKHLANAFAKQIAVLLYRLKLEQELRTQKQSLERWINFNASLMAFVSETLERGLDESFYQRLLDHAIKGIPGVEAGSILIQKADSCYHFVAAYPYDLKLLETISLQEHEMILSCDAVAPLLIQDLKAHNEQLLSEEKRQIMLASGPVANIKTMLCIPVRLNAKVVASLSLDAFSTNAFSEEVQDMAASFASQIATLLQRLSLQTELEKRNAELAELANFDVLTHLPNRSLFLDRLKQALRSAQRSGHEVALFFVDLDGFKLINDSLGHSVGDQVLQRVADRLRNNLRYEDTVARLGGDEFTVVMNLTAPEQAMTIAKKILEVLAEPFEVADSLLHIGCSIGISLYPKDGHSSEALLKHADMAMYHAKASGKNRYHFFTPTMNDYAFEQLQLENDLRLALERGEMYLVYQPRVSLKDGSVSSFEALARWQHSKKGAIPPTVFIPLAERTGLIHQFGRKILRQACEQARLWQEAGLDLRVAVNLSVKQLQQATIVQEVAGILADVGLDANRLELELTESAAMTDVETTISTLQAFRNLGIYLSIDDFGTAYSSLNYLKRLPFNSLKIDKSFVQDLHNHKKLDATNLAIIQAIIALGHSLNLDIVAEGVENEAQRTVLADLGCQEAQGYWYSPPMPSEKTLTWQAQAFEGAFN